MSVVQSVAVEKNGGNPGNSNDDPSTKESQQGVSVQKLYPLLIPLSSVENREMSQYVIC